MYFVIYVVLRTNYRFWLDILCISPSIRYRVLAKTWFYDDYWIIIIYNEYFGDEEAPEWRFDSERPT